MLHNPNWTRDELILALDLYFRVEPSRVSSNHPDIVALSDLLNSLPIHDGNELAESFRNPNGVYMKLCNFLRFDPGYSGEGLTKGSKLDEVIWNEFSKDRKMLQKVANGIRHNYESVMLSKDLLLVDREFEDVVVEGKVLVRLHKIKERNFSIVNAKKKQVLSKKGKLECEVCGFDFEEVYGELGKGFAECHHLVPIAELNHEQETKLSDLAIVCSNCHRMLHRGASLLTLEELREVIICNQ